MASGGDEEKYEIWRLVDKTNTERLKEEGKKHTSKTEEEVNSMPRELLKECMLKVRRALAASALVRNAGSVGGTPIGTPVRKDGSALLDIGNKESEVLQVAWASETAKARLQDREDKLEKEKRDEKVRMQEREDRLGKEEKNRKEKVQDREEKNEKEKKDREERNEKEKKDKEERVERERLEGKRRAQEKEDR